MKSGRYNGGTYAHKDIALEFASWISAEVKLYIIKEFQRHKYEIKMNDIVIENKYIVNLIDLYKRKMGL